MSENIEVKLKLRKEKLKELLVNSDWELRQFKNRLRPYIRELEDYSTKELPGEDEEAHYIRSQWIEVFKLLDMEHELSAKSD